VAVKLRTHRIAFLSLKLSIYFKTNKYTLKIQPVRSVFSKRNFKNNFNLCLNLLKTYYYLNDKIILLDWQTHITCNNDNWNGGYPENELKFMALSKYLFQTFHEMANYCLKRFDASVHADDHCTLRQLTLQAGIHLWLRLQDPGITFSEYSLTNI